MIFGLIILVIVAYYLFNSSHDKGFFHLNPLSQVKTPMDILDERYAKGEINQEDYLERKQVLAGQKQTISIKKDKGIS